MLDLIVNHRLYAWKLEEQENGSYEFKLKPTTAVVDLRTAPKDANNKLIYPPLNPANE
ncbi:MAG: hypothetical protein IPP79_20730 [Chitinophagaceae bacterium]|nr:hypothetical protein [Chitinophagaceae bacterium]